MAKSKYPDMVKPRFPEIRAWLEAGLTERQIAKNVGVSKATFETYKHKYPDFLALIKKGRATLVREVENALVKRALGFEYVEISTEIKDDDGRDIHSIKKVTKYYPPDVGACAILLKNKDRENWSDNPQMIELRRQMLELEKQKFKETQW